MLPIVQQQYSDVAIETVLTLRLLFHLPHRQAEGFVRSLFGMMALISPRPITRRCPGAVGVSTSDCGESRPARACT